LVKARKCAPPSVAALWLTLAGATAWPGWTTVAQESAPARRKPPAAAPTGAEKPAASQTAKPAVPPAGTETPKPKPPMAETLRGYLGRMRGVKSDKPGKEADTIVTHYAPSGKGDEIDVVIVHSPKKKMVGFYIYDFGNVSRASDQAALSGFLLNANDRLAIGSFFIDKDQDIGLKFSLRTENGVSFDEFQTVYYGLAAAAKEYRGQVAERMERVKDDAPKREPEKPPEDAERTKPDATMKVEPPKAASASVPPAAQSAPKPESGETRRRRVNAKKN
jgi:hypothetical protein